MKNYLILLLITGFLNVSQPLFGNVLVKGELRRWHKITLIIDGTETSEFAEVNPFLDYFLVVEFKNGNVSYKVPGYYAVDGNAAEFSASQGNKCIIHEREVIC